ncbi:hypothetical protein IQ244_15110 [Nostoc sp. LEGE 06077]|uniref:competence protein CoiA family protein n=1 Tax=Nostoc sp. LEGE 06077 TaxID=915325 RepID=UPI0018801E5A|nr:competence protein CoiA family protein [Nostoc sp. LEGE 06077]MBE9207825.1 hypothetical protein [Nostoc sp. LEGE 06077]
MTPIAFHVEGQKPIKSEDYKTLEELESEYPGLKICPICEGVLHFVSQSFKKVNNKMTPVGSYFRHENEEANKLCPTRNMGESIEHLWIKVETQRRYKEAANYAGFKNMSIEIEKNVNKPNGYNRPDILIKNNDKAIFAVEVQTSGISAQKQADRSFGHKAAGIDLTDWRCGNNNASVERAIRYYGFAHTTEVYKDTYEELYDNGFFEQKILKEKIRNIEFTLYHPNQNGIRATIDSHAQLLEKALQVSTGSNGLLSPDEKPKFQNRNPFIPEEHIELCKSLTPVVDLLKSGIHHHDLIGWYVQIKGQITTEGIIHAIEPICQKTVLIQPLYSEQRQIVSIELVSIVNWNETICGSTIEDTPKVNPEPDRIEPQKPLIWQVGDHASWKNAPSWWNPYGEEIISIENNKCMINYWGSPIDLTQLFPPNI